MEPVHVGLGTERLKDAIHFVGVFLMRSLSAVLVCGKTLHKEELVAYSKIGVYVNDTGCFILTQLSWFECMYDWP